ncbi:hypothetical protein PM082_006631 [Marasmius tenuissimus]|nr:hypothetical protein PM082_006631 [Marasmius tenuissimus]
MESKLGHTGMVMPKKLFPHVPLALVCASLGNALPSVGELDLTRRASTHHIRNLNDGLQVISYHPTTTYQTFGEGIEPSSASLKTRDSNIEDQVISFVASALGIDPIHVGFRSGYTTEDGTTHGYARQFHNGIPFSNAVANVAFKNNKVIAFGHSFVNINKIANSNPTLDVNSATAKAEEVLQGKKNIIEPALEYLLLEDGLAALVHVIEIQNWRERETKTWYKAYVDAHSGKLVSINDFVSHASYKVLPIWKQTPDEGYEVIVDPQLLTAASPAGWHLPEGNSTEGNNVAVYIGHQFQDPLNTTLQSSPGLVFNYTYDASQDPAVTSNQDAARTNVFYLANTFHDTLYLYGFTENAFNFQNDNFGKGGVGGDRFLVSVQSTLGMNNGFTATPPDGRSGRTELTLWDLTNPQRDGAMENDLVIHESTHGMTSRMTGGGTAQCLDTREAGGLDEGWADAVANWFSHSATPEVHDFYFVPWVTNGNSTYFRTGPYWTSVATNSLRYSDLSTRETLHEMGEIWANILHNVYSALVTKHGWSSAALTDSTGSSGNVVWLHLIVDGLALQPCNPTFTTARDAIIQADTNRYGGVNRCLLWKVFASRGLGVEAKDYVDSDTVPEGC